MKTARWTASCAPLSLRCKPRSGPSMTHETMVPPAPHLFSAEIEVVPAFYDLDPMEIVWHGHYVKYMELARCALLERFDYGYPQMRASGYAWPVVDLRVKYLRSASFAQRIKVRAEIVEWENRL